jgi:hypothetical protein
MCLKYLQATTLPRLDVCVLRASRFAFIFCCCCCCCCCRLWLQEQRFSDRGFLINFLIHIRALAVSNDFLLQELVFLSCRSVSFGSVVFFVIFCPLRRSCGLALLIQICESR